MKKNTELRKLKDEMSDVRAALRLQLNIVADRLTTLESAVNQHMQTNIKSFDELTTRLAAQLAIFGTKLSPVHDRGRRKLKPKGRKRG